MSDGNTISSLTSSDSSSESQSDLNDSLLEKRKLIRDLLVNKDGDNQEWYFISKKYLDEFLNLSVDSFEDLKSQLGPVDCMSIVDANGHLYPINQEPIETFPVISELFNYLTNWFGIKGNAIKRHSIKNSRTGLLEIERYPIIFNLHQIGKKQNHSTYYSRQQVHQTSPQLLTMFRMNTFYDLLDQIRIQCLKLPKKQPFQFRVWFIESPNITELPFIILLNTFLFEIKNKSLINCNILPDTLSSHGVNNVQYHLAIELIDGKGVNAKFPVDSYIDQIDLNAYSNLVLNANLGLNNLGNTCYMNSALQCLLHIPEISYFFFYNLYKRELNPKNPLGYHGDVANSFGSLLKQIVDPSKSSSIAPREFKSTIGRYSSMFSGYMQQDSQELLSWLLDALHEDLNRIHVKPYSEKPELKDDELADPRAISKLAKTCWDQYKSRNDSVIVDLFTGLYQSTLVCPTCSKTSITFDPYNDLTLPLPINKKWYHTFTIVDLSESGILGDQRIQKLEVELTKTSNFTQLVTYISNFFQANPDHFFFYEIFRSFFYTDFQLDYNRNKFLPVSDLIREADDIYVYYIPHDPDVDIIIPVLNSVDDSDKSYNVSELFGIPLFVLLNKESDLCSFGKIRKKLEDLIQLLTKANIKEEYNRVKMSDSNYIAKDFYSPNDFPKILAANDVNESGKSESDGYDSDVSLANPYTSADLGFVIEYYNSTSKLASRHRFGANHFGKNRINTENIDRVIHIPNGPPNLREFKPLSEKLPELKKNYYHYPNFSNKSISAGSGVADEITPNSEGEKSTDEGFVLDENADSVELKSDTIEQPGLSLSDDENEEPRMQSLLDDKLASDCSLPPTVPDSVKNSGQNSPVSIQDSSLKNPVVTNDPRLVGKDTILLCNWNQEIFRQFFQEENQTWISPPTIANLEIKKSKAKFERQRNQKVSLYDCLKMFSTPEILGEHDLWYCPRCKEHKQATKSIQLWSSGDILTIHLKRFHSARAFSDKIDMLVEFPIEGLDISNYIADPDSDNNIYDLIAVDNHYGGLGGGHYTAAAKSFGDNCWYNFNDSRVTTIKPEETITPAAYLLFYRRRSGNNEELLGGEKLVELIKNGREAYKTSLDVKRTILENLSNQLKAYWRFEELKQKQKQNDFSNLEKSNDADDDADDDDNDEDDDNEDENNSNSCKSSLKRTPIDTAQFKHEEEVNLYSDDENEDEEVDHDINMNNSRKQRLISKENNNNKLLQIKSNGRQEMTLSPRLAESSNDNDVDHISECNEI